MLEECLMPSVKQGGGNEMVWGCFRAGKVGGLYKDHDPKHTSKLCKNYLGKKQEAGILSVMEWPAQSPDLNPTELLWEQLDHMVRKKCPSSQTKLWNGLLEAWSESPDYLSKLTARMPKICNAVIAANGAFFDESKVFIYVDAIINHMCGAGGGAGTGSTCGSSYNAGSRDFPAVPYSNLDFNDGKCRSSSGDIENYGDAYQVRDCRLVSLLDLALEKEYVRTKIADYLNNLISIGVAGFRLDASKHMWPGDIKAITNKLNNLNTQWFASGSRPFIFQEVIDLGGEAISASEYYGNGRVTEFKYGAKLGNVIRKWNGEKMSYLRNWGEGWGFMPNNRALVFVDNHDNQRGHGAGGASILTFFDARLYKMGVGFMLAHPYGLARVMSSYRWTRNFVNGQDVNDWIGPPMNSDGSTKTVTINADST
ncbi:unnamed protein product [Ranitomeya imitator]|uniref:alpha-amylase n=1 Tax=Ranitomeya imitator TaxID=111125 RepID=A0ABN9L5P5_9NEOB|nr:unnamed protein product [Ranitomeya imitator]